MSLRGPSPVTPRHATSCNPSPVIPRRRAVLQYRNTPLSPVVARSVYSNTTSPRHAAYSSSQCQRGHFPHLSLIVWSVLKAGVTTTCIWVLCAVKAAWTLPAFGSCLVCSQGRRGCYPHLGFVCIQICVNAGRILHGLIGYFVRPSE